MRIESQTEPQSGSDEVVSTPVDQTPATLDYAASGSAPALDRRYVVAALMMVMVLASMEQTVTSTAMPTIIGDLKGLEHYSWVASIYLLACTISMPLYGRLADVLGRKKVIVFSITLFCIASLLAAASHNILQLIIFRGLQGLGAGGIMPVVLTIAGDIFTIHERPKVQGYFSAVWGAAALGGPMLGAGLVKAFGWRSVFYINLPLGALGLAVLMWKYHDREKPHSTDLDLPGVLMLAGACTAALALVSGLGPGGWPGPACAILGAVAVIATLLFVMIERKAANPILPPDLMVKRAIGPSLLASGLLGVGFLSLDTYVPLYVQGAHGGGAGAAAAVVTPVMLTWATSGVFAAPAILRLGFRRTAMIGSIITFASFMGLLGCAVWNAPRWAITADLAVAGLGFGPASMATLLASQDAVAWQQRGIITSAVTFFRTVGGAMGIGVLGMLFNVLIRPELSRLHGLGVNPADLMDPSKRDRLPPESLHAASGMIAGGLTWVFAAMLIFAAMQLLASLFMPGKKAAGPISKAEAMEAMAGA
ncbi:MAG: arabinose efflux permease family protein [Phycisphaerales bacterium]|nr:arabinose efflux permease family protein [Phycisphaerales bacterium]